MAQVKVPDRPLSPHLQIYRLSWTMAMSIVHRITGAANYFGAALVAIWLVAMASGPLAYDRVQWFFGSWIGRRARGGGGIEGREQFARLRRRAPSRSMRHRGRASRRQGQAPGPTLGFS